MPKQVTVRVFVGMYSLKLLLTKQKMIAMNLKRTISYITLLLAFSLVLFTACNKDGENNLQLTEEEQSAYEAEESTESFFDVVESITNSAIQYSEASAGGRITIGTDPEIACAAIVLSGTTESGRIELNFGEGCTGPDGKTRKGTVVVEYEGNWLTQGAVTWTILKDFYVDGLKIEGTRTVTTKAVDLEKLELIQSVKIDEGKVIWPDGTYITRQSERTHKLLIGENWTGIQIEVSGVASGITRAGVAYSAVTEEPLVFKTECRGSAYIPASGIKVITIPDLPLITVNYGDGACDNKFTIIMDRGSKEIAL